MATKTCGRCSGERNLWQFSNVLGGKCFACNGTGRRTVMRVVKTEVEVYFARHELGGEKVADSDRAVAQAKVDAWTAQGLEAWIEPRTVIRREHVPA